MLDLRVIIASASLAFDLFAATAGNPGACMDAFESRAYKISIADFSA